MKRIIALFIVLSLILTGCTLTENGNRNNDSDRLSIVTTVFPLYDFSRAVAGSSADITMLIKPGAEIHSFDPSPADIIAIQNADIFLYIGGSGDAWVDTILESMDGYDVKAVKLIDYVDTLSHDHEDEHDEHDHENEHENDEHIWTSLENAKAMINVISAGISSVDEENATLYRENADKYKAEIDLIIDEISDIVDNSSSKTLIVADRFPFLYFAKEFGLDYISAFDACGSESEASAGVLADLISEIKRLNAPYVFYTELSNKNIANIIEEQLGVPSLELHSCHNVTRDDFENGETYVTLWKRNVYALRKGLIY